MTSPSRTGPDARSRAGLRGFGLSAVVLVAGIALYWAHLVPAAIAANPRPVIHSDFYSYFLPKFSYGTRALLAGEVPLWNPYEYLGLPFLGTAQPAVFYPPKLALFGALEPATAYWAFLVVHALAMAGGLLWFLRSQGVGAVAALAGAVVWCFSQSTLLSMYHPVRPASLVWAPLAFWLAHRLQGGFRPGAFAALVVVVALQLLAGYPEFPLDLSLMLFVYAVVQWWRGAWRPPWQTVPIFAGAYVVAALITAPQLLPLLEVVAGTQRVALADQYESPFGDALFSARLLTLQAFPAMLAFLGIGAFERRARGAITLYVLALALALGGWQWLRLVPGFSVARSGFAWALFLPFLAAWVSAFGVDRVVQAFQQEAEGRRVRLALALVMGGVAGFAAWHGLRGGLPPLWTLETFGPGPLAAGLCCAVGLGFVALVARQRRAPEWAIGVGVALAMLAQMTAFPFWMKLLPIVVQPDPLAMAERSTAQPPGRSLSLDNLQYGHTLLDGVESLFGMEVSLMPWRYRALVAHFDHNLLMSTTNWGRLAEARGFLDATDVQYLVAPRLRAGEIRAHGLRRVDDAPNRMAVFENPDRLGRAWVSYGARVVSSAEAARDAVLSPSFDPGRQVILEGTPSRRYPERAPEGPSPARVERPATDRLRVHASLPRPGILVVSEAGAPGWTARVDAAPREWLQANYLLRAVELDAGEHVVEFHYRPRSWLVALVSAALGSLLCLGFAAASVRQRLRGEPRRAQDAADRTGGRREP